MAEQGGEVSKLHEEIEYLEDQGGQYIKKLEEKEARIRELEVQNRRTTE
jgi:TolA-binding protein